MTPPARRHLSLLAAVFFLLLAAGAWLGQAERLIQPSTLIYGPGYADVNGRMPGALRTCSRRGHWRCAGGDTSIHAAQLADSGRRWPVPPRDDWRRRSTASMLQRFVVTPNEQTRESPFIQHNIDATRRAFALDRVEARELTGDATADTRRHRA